MCVPFTILLLSANAKGDDPKAIFVSQPPVDFFGGLNLSPVSDSQYTIIPGLGGEDSSTGEQVGFFLGIQPDPDTGVVNHATMDGQSDLIGIDFAEMFGWPANNVEAFECLQTVGRDNNRFVLRLTVGVRTTSTKLQWDTFEFDLKDPADVCLLYTSPSPRDKRQSRMPSSA